MTETWKHPSTELVDILNRYNINGWNSSGGTDKNTWHNYTGIYETLLTPYRHRPGRLLEIGCAFGGSALLWHTFLPKFLICMVDINNTINPIIWDHMRYQRFQFNWTNAYTPETIDLFRGMYPEGFDVVIDDGNHDFEQQVFTINHYLPMIRPGGVLIIEDIQSPDHIQSFTNMIPDHLKQNIKVFDNRDTKNRYDDLIFSVKL